MKAKEESKNPVRHSNLQTGEALAVPVAEVMLCVSASSFAWFLLMTLFARIKLPLFADFRLNLRELNTHPLTGMYFQ